MWQISHNLGLVDAYLDIGVNNREGYCRSGKCQEGALCGEACQSSALMNIYNMCNDWTYRMSAGKSRGTSEVKAGNGRGGDQASEDNVDEGRSAHFEMKGWTATGWQA